MPVNCKICNDKLHKGRDNLILCKHKGGFVHRDCCELTCSMHGAPCTHAICEYRKVDLERVSPELFSFID
ncbi:MAG: hypothetical protein U9Q92_03900 [archaeon]|nr:hypothetical protein [archaeon]